MTVVETMQALCKATGTWGLYLHTFCPSDFDLGTYFAELPLAAPGLTGRDYDALRAEGEVILLFGSQDACNSVYDTVIGDDGPKGGNEYNGRARVYALTCDSDGQLRNENT